MLKNPHHEAAPNGGSRALGVIVGALCAGPPDQESARRTRALSPCVLPGGSGDVGGDDVGGVAVQRGAGPTWWTRLLELSECGTVLSTGLSHFRW